MPVVASATLEVTPVLSGAQQSLTEQLTGAAAPAAEKAGEESGGKLSGSLAKGIAKGSVAVAGAVAAVGGAFVPLLTMGIPGSSSTALILNVFLIHGLQPGPNLFTNQPDLVYPIFASMLIVNILILFVPKYLIKYIVKVLQVPFKYMGVAIMFVAMIGAFAINNRIQDVWLTLIFGLIGFLMTKYQYSPAAMALGLILGPILEKNFRQMLQIYRGEYSLFFSRPIAVVMTVIALILIGKGIYDGIRTRTKAKQSQAQPQ